MPLREKIKKEQKELGRINNEWATTHIEIAHLKTDLREKEAYHRGRLSAFWEAERIMEQQRTRSPHPIAPNNTHNGH